MCFVVSLSVLSPQPAQMWLLSQEVDQLCLVMSPVSGEVSDLNTDTKVIIIIDSILYNTHLYNLPQ